MRIPTERLAQIDADAPELGFKASQISLAAKMRRVNASVRKQIEEHHQGAFALFEEAVKFIIAFEAFHLQRKKHPKEVTPFVLMLARVRGDLLSIRNLLLAGQESSALAVGRVYMEDIELAMATAVDPEFALLFMETKSPDAFWSNNIGYGKIYPYVEKFLHLGKLGKLISVTHTANHRAMKSFLSQHIHPTSSSALRLAVPKALEHPGYCARWPTGWFGETSGRLCLYIADDVQAFAATCINAFIRPNPPPALADYKRSKALTTFMRPAHNLQTLLRRYSKRMYVEYDKKSKQWDVAVEYEA